MSESTTEGTWPELEALRDGTMPSASTGFVDDLDVRLRVAHAAGDRSPGPTRTVGPRRLVLTLGVVALVAVVLLVVLATGGPTTVELLESQDVVLRLPDGTEIDAEPGLALPPGSTAVTGPDGFARFESGEIGPDTEATVFEDRIEVTEGRGADDDPGAGADRGDGGDADDADTPTRITPTTAAGPAPTRAVDAAPSRGAGVGDAVAPPPPPTPAAGRAPAERPSRRDPTTTEAPRSVRDRGDGVDANADAPSDRG